MCLGQEERELCGAIRIDELNNFMLIAQEIRVIFATQYAGGA